MSFEETWSGDWQGRVLERVRQRGFETVTQYADELRDLLVRELRHGLPEGWRYPPDDESRSEVARTLGRWKLDLKEHLDADATFAAGQDFMKAELPTGWLPGGSDDLVIVAFVERCLGHRPS